MLKFAPYCTWFNIVNNHKNVNLFGRSSYLSMQKKVNISTYNCGLTIISRVWFIGQQMVHEIEIVEKLISQRTCIPATAEKVGIVASEWWKNDTRTSNAYLWFLHKIVSAHSTSLPSWSNVWLFIAVTVDISFLCSRLSHWALLYMIFSVENRGPASSSSPAEATEPD